MSAKDRSADTHKFKMKPQPGSPPAIEVDDHGNTIPLRERTKEDQRAARAAGETDTSLKNPEKEAEHPAPMPSQQ